MSPNKEMKPIRMPTKLINEIEAVQKMKGFSTFTASVLHLIETGLTFYQVRKAEIDKIKQKIKNYNIEKWELN